MAEKKEKQLFDVIHNLGETATSEYQIQRIDEEEGIWYKCDYGIKGSFEIRRINNLPEYGELYDQTGKSADYLYSFAGSFNSNVIEMSAHDAYELVMHHLK